MQYRNHKHKPDKLEFLAANALMNMFIRQKRQYISLSLQFNGHFPSGPRLAGTRMSPFWILLEPRVMEVAVTTGAIRLQSKYHHQQTNTQFFYRSDPTNSVKALKGQNRQQMHMNNTESDKTELCNDCEQSAM